MQLQSMSASHNKIAQLMAVIYETFAEDGAEVRPLGVHEGQPS